MTRRQSCLLLLLLTGFVVFPTSRPLQAEPLVADLSDHLIAITTVFTGAEVLLFGATDGPGDGGPGARADGRAVVRRKDRIFGIWSTAAFDFRRCRTSMPWASSRPLAQLLTPEMAQRSCICPYAFSLAAGADTPGPSAGDMLQALTRIKIREGLFQPDAGKVTFLGAQLFRVDFRFPANVPTGSYLVEILLIRDGRIVSAQTTPLVVSKIGVGADIFEFAHRYAAAYGIIAIVMALLAGWAAHLVFRRI
jgi:uncharacterized protein (TIGR02186 family)